MSKKCPTWTDSGAQYRLIGRMTECRTVGTKRWYYSHTVTPFEADAIREKCERGNEK